MKSKKEYAKKRFQRNLLKYGSFEYVKKFDLLKELYKCGKIEKSVWKEIKKNRRT